ncbi:MAG TPA: kelch repeat-containing protein, partial [Candidatus Angelobacter sp.]|nr:kelch repeat-containing protein [Candidatus Angelobacter sp.]
MIDRLAKFGLAFVLLFSLMVLLAVTTIPKNGHPGTLATAGVTTVGRFSHTATLLEGDKVLIAGGMERNGVWLDSGEVFDDATGRFIATARMSSRRAGAMAVALPDGKALIAGGSDGSDRNLARAEIYDPQTNSFSLTGSMNAPRAHGVAIFLPRINKALIIGGAANGDDNEHASAELYDPATGRFSQTGSMRVPRAYFNAVLLRDGRVLVMGGMSSDLPNPNIEASAEIYDPALGRFLPVGPMNVSRFKHGVALLPDGKVLVLGGQTGSSYGERLASTEIFDPA